MPWHHGKDSCVATRWNYIIPSNISCLGVFRTIYYETGHCPIDVLKNYWIRFPRRLNRPRLNLSDKAPSNEGRSYCQMLRLNSCKLSSAPIEECGYLIEYPYHECLAIHGRFSSDVIIGSSVCATTTKLAVIKAPLSRVCRDPRCPSWGADMSMPPDAVWVDLPTCSSSFQQPRLRWIMPVFSSTQARHSPFAEGSIQS